jgi:hypothetical protein
LIILSNEITKLDEQIRYSTSNSLIDKEKAIIADGLSSMGSLIDERFNYNPMMEFIPIRKWKG